MAGMDAGMAGMDAGMAGMKPRDVGGGWKTQPLKYRQFALREKRR